MEQLFRFTKAALSAVSGCIVYWLGGLDRLLTLLIAVIVLDYITGMLAAVHHRVLSSAVGFRGIAKKVLLLGVVALSFIIEELTGAALPMREVTIMFFVVNEGLSILENAAATGLPLPAKLVEMLVQLGKGKHNNKGE